MKAEGEHGKIKKKLEKFVGPVQHIMPPSAYTDAQREA